MFIVVSYLLLYHIFSDYDYNSSSTTSPSPPHLHFTQFISPCRTVWIMDWQKTWLIVIYCRINHFDCRICPSRHCHCCILSCLFLYHVYCCIMFIVVSCLLSYHVYCCIMFIIVLYLWSYHCYCCIMFIVVSIVMTTIPTVHNRNLTGKGSFWQFLILIRRCYHLSDNSPPLRYNWLLCHTRIIAPASQLLYSRSTNVINLQNLFDLRPTVDEW